MTRRQNDFLLGITTIAILAIFMATIIFIYPRWGEEGRLIELRFPHTEGVAPLKPGSPVLLSGAIQVGEVADVRTAVLDQPPPAPPGEKDLYIIVWVRVNDDLKLYSDCLITTSQPAIGGTGSVVILSVGSSHQKLVDAGPIYGGRPQGFAATLNALSDRLLGPNGLMDRVEGLFDATDDRSLVYKIGRSLDDVNAMTASLKLQLDPQESHSLIEKVHLLADNLAQTTGLLRDQARSDNDDALIAQLHRTLDTLNDALVNAGGILSDNRAALGRTVQNVEQATAAIDQKLVAALQRELDRDDPQALLGKLHSGMDRVNDSLDNVFALSEQSRQMIVLNRPSLERTIANLREASNQLALGLAEVRLAPWKVFLKATPEEIDRTGVLAAARNFAQAATDLDDAAQRMDALLAASQDDPVIASPEEINAIRAALKSAFERFGKAEEYLFERMKQ